MPNMNGQVQKVEINFHTWHEAVSDALKPVRDQIIKPLRDAGYGPFDKSAGGAGWGTAWHFTREGGLAYLEVVYLPLHEFTRGSARDNIALYSAVLEAAGVEHTIYDGGQPSPVYDRPHSLPFILIPAVEVPPMPDLTVTIRATIVG